MAEVAKDTPLSDSIGKAPTPVAEGNFDKVLSLDEMLQAEDVQYATVVIPEWKGSIRIGSLSAGEVLDFIEMTEGPAKKNAGFRLISRSLVDAEGKRIGSDSKIEAFRKKDSRVV